MTSDATERVIERVASYDDVAASHSQFRAEPLVVTNAVKDWPLCADGKAVLSELDCFAGSALVSALHLSYDESGEQSAFANEDALLSSLLVRAASAEGSDISWYLQWRDLPHPPGANGDSDGATSAHDEQQQQHDAYALMQRVRRPACIGATALRQANAWIGASRTSHLHFDGLDNILVVAAGEKEVILFPPSMLLELYPDLREKWKSSARSTLYLRPGQDDFPRLRAAPRLRATIRAGEALWIPAGWWHEVLTPRVTVAFNFWYPSHACARLRPTSLFLNSELYARRILEGSVDVHEVDNDAREARSSMSPSKRSRTGPGTSSSSPISQAVGEGG